MDEQTSSGKPRVNLVRKVYKGVAMFENEVEEIETMDTREDDIWVCSSPRSGTTLMQELSFLVQTLDFEKCKTMQLDEIFPVVDLKDDRFPYYKGFKLIEQLPSPRFIKCHLHYSMLPQQLKQGKGRLIYIARNPKDIVTSFYKLFLWMDQLIDGDKTYDEYFDTFIDGTALYGPWPRHVLEYWGNRNNGNILFMKYENVVKDMPTAVRQVAKFLDRKLTDDQVDAICQHCHVDKMRANNKANMSYYRDFKHVNDHSNGGFINKGKAGVWKTHLTTEQSALIDEMVKELDGSGLVFDEE